MTTALTDDERNARIWIAIGKGKWMCGRRPGEDARVMVAPIEWKPENWLTDEEHPEHYPRFSDWARFLPHFATSLDALLAPGGPIELCEKKGWNWAIEGFGTENRFAKMFRGPATLFEAEHSVPARALAECALACLEYGEEQ